DLAPFRAALAAGVRAVMSAHVVVPELTGTTPATLSSAAIQGLLRGQLGFDGVVVTDAVDMGAIAGTVGIGEGAVRALIAGADMVCIGPSKGADVVAEVQGAIVAAVRSGRLPEDRLVDAGRRIDALVDWVTTAPRAERDGQVGLVAARRAIKFEGVRPHLVRPLVVELEEEFNLAVSPGMPWGLASALRSRDPDTEEVTVSRYDGRIEPLLTSATDRSVIVVARDAHRYPWQQRLISELATRRPDTVLVEMGLPIWRPSEIAAYVATYGVGRSNAAAAVELLAAG
ncbi:MAG TPA: glycoside hydrolase family 3 N-terminal domain-containing protein, partial [Actinomycetes bacterium]|nr:glycoside hydrolase family 3 N-terminal domain-containing protein [Actinomycetes bacterium]